jgi:hypothetical protein
MVSVNVTAKCTKPKVTAVDIEVVGEEMRNVWQYVVEEEMDVMAVEQQEET